MKDKVIIRKANKDDLNKISQLFYKEMFESFKLVGEKPISTKEYESILKKNFRKSKMLVLNDNGIKGFIWYFKKNNEFNIEEIFVVRKDKGYGKLLINYMIEDAKKNKVKKINLDVHFKNKKAIKFFKNFNFCERTIEMSLDLK